MGDLEDADASTAIDGGSIVIHKGKGKQLVTERVV
jgi:hypothetical protein